MWAPGPFRLVAVLDRSPLLFMDLHDWWADPCFLRPREVARILGPWSSADLRRCKEPSHSPGWWKWWARETVLRLDGVLPDGLWWVVGRDCASPPATVPRWPGPPATGVWPPPPPAHGLSRIEEARRAWIDAHADVSPGELLALRPPADESDGRLKFWRKQAQLGACPPALCVYLPVYERHVILDGHERLRAAQITGRPAPVLSVFAVWKTSEMDERIARYVEAMGRWASTPSQVERLNDAVRIAHGERTTHPILRVRPFPQGHDGWLDAVRSATRDDPEVDPAVLDCLLADRAQVHR